MKGRFFVLFFILFIFTFGGFFNTIPMNGFAIEKSIIEESVMIESTTVEESIKEIVEEENIDENFIEKNLNQGDFIREAVVKGKNVILSEVQVVSEQNRNKEIENESFIAEDSLTIDFIDVGQGDATLISYGGESLLIDTGSELSSEDLNRYVHEKGANDLKYVLITHEDKDHMGGLYSLLENFNTSNLLISTFLEKSNMYDDLKNLIVDKDINIENPKEGNIYELGDGEAYFKIIMAPEELEEVDSFKTTNSFSIGIILYYKDFSALFMGDAHEGMELDLIDSRLNLNIDVYKVSNHGSNASSSIDFLKAMTPKAAIISCGEDNIEGYPRSEVLYNLKQLEVPFYRTDDQGNIELVTNGKDFIFNCSPSNNFKGRDGVIHEDMETYFSKSCIEENYNYVLNINNKKIHIDSCSGVKNILNEDIDYSNKTLDKLLKDGYMCCNICLSQDEEDSLISRVFYLVNEERKKVGLKELSWSDDLEVTSNVRVEEIKDSFSHTRPNGEEWYTVNDNIMYGENLAKDYDTAENVFDAWMESISHKENILFTDFKTISISMSKNNDGKYYWVQEFGY